MTKTAARRHQQQRHMRRRLRYPVWAWAALDPVMRSRASRHSVPCSCDTCKAGLDELAAYKRRKTTTEDIGG